MSVIGAVREYLLSCPLLAADAPVGVNWHDCVAGGFGVSPIPGKTVAEDIAGNRIVSYPFAVYSAASTADDAERLQTADFYEDFAAWLDAQTEAGNLPLLDGEKRAVSVEALDQEAIIQRAEDTGIYQILCRLVYEEKGAWQ